MTKEQRFTAPTVNDIMNEMQKGLEFDVQWRTSEAEKKIKTLPMMQEVATKFEYLYGHREDEIQSATFGAYGTDATRVSVTLGQNGTFKVMAPFIEWIEGRFACTATVKDTDSSRDFIFKRDDNIVFVLWVFPGASNHCKITRVATGETTPVTRTVIECDDSEKSNGN